eukprot:1964888-Amphidinium_carterae.1
MATKACNKHNGNGDGRAEGKINIATEDVEMDYRYALAVAVEMLPELQSTSFSCPLETLSFFELQDPLWHWATTWPSLCSSSVPPTSPPGRS